MLKSYAQNFEDVILRRALRDVGHGFYIDIGAQDPREFSVSRGFYELGWRGLHVEPVPAYAEELRRDRPDEIVVEAMVGAERGAARFYSFPNTGLSTALPEIARHHERLGFGMEEAQVDVVTLDDLFNRHVAGEVHWLKIDVEGAERDVLKGWQQGARKPWIVVVESVSPTDMRPSHAEWEPLLLARGYSFAYFDGLNRFYVSSEHSQRLAYFGPGPNVFDDFTLADDTPFCRQLAADCSAFRQRAEDFERELASARLALSSHIAGVQERAARLEIADALANERLEHVNQLREELTTLRQEWRRDVEATLRYENEVRSLKTQIEREAAERDWALGELAAMKYKTASAAQRETGLQQRLFGVEAHAAMLDEKARTAEARLAEQQQRMIVLSEAASRAQALNEQVQALYRSTSWRVTAPLRRVKSLGVTTKWLSKLAHRGRVGGAFDAGANPELTYEARHTGAHVARGDASAPTLPFEPDERIVAEWRALLNTHTN